MSQLILLIKRWIPVKSNSCLESLCASDFLNTSCLISFHPHSKRRNRLLLSFYRWRDWLRCGQVTWQFGAKTSQQLFASRVQLFSRYAPLSPRLQMPRDAAAIALCSLILSIWIFTSNSYKWLASNIPLQWWCHWLWHSMVHPLTFY